MFIKIGDKRVNTNNIVYYTPYFTDRIQISYRNNVGGQEHEVIMCGDIKTQEQFLKRLDFLTGMETLDHFPDKPITLE